MNQENQNIFNFHSKKTMLDLLYKERRISFIEFYESLLSLFEEHHIQYAK